MYIININKQMKYILTILTLALPQLSFAEAPLTNSILGIVEFLVFLASQILPLIIIAALVLFLFGIAKRFFWGGDDGVKSGQYILWGIVGLFAMVSVWGLVNLLRNTFKLNNEVTPDAPRIIRPQSDVNTHKAGASDSAGAFLTPENRL